MTLVCVSCGSDLVFIEEVRHPSGEVQLAFYRCQDEACRRVAVVWWETMGQTTKPAVTQWIEREVASRGAFFPSNGIGYGPSRYGR